MCTKDAVKARIKKLEGELLGLVYRLQNLSTQPSLFSQVSDAFNAGSAKADLNKRFHTASRFEDAIKLQIASIRNELAVLSPYNEETIELNMAA